MRSSRKWLRRGFTFVGFVALTALTVWAQPPGPPREQGGQRGGTPPGPPPGGFGGPGFGFGFGGLVDLARRSDVRKELELLDDQVEKLDKLNEARGERMRKMFSGMEDVPREQRFEKMRELGQKEQQQTDRELEQILLPHQLKRLKQLEMQTRARGGVQALFGDRAPEELALSAEQKEKLQKRAAELEEQLRQKTAELRKQNQDELLRMLTPQQQAKWKDLMGDPFEFQRLDPWRPGGPGGPGGGPGGPDRGRGGQGGGAGGGSQRPPR